MNLQVTQTKAQLKAKLESLSTIDSVDVSKTNLPCPPGTRRRLGENSTRRRLGGEGDSCESTGGWQFAITFKGEHAYVHERHSET